MMDGMPHKPAYNTQGLGDDGRLGSQGPGGMKEKKMEENKTACSLPIIARQVT